MKKENNEIISLLSSVASKCAKTKDRGALLIKLMTVEDNPGNEAKIQSVFKDLKAASQDVLMDSLINDLKQIRALYKDSNEIQEQVEEFIEGLMGLKAAKDFVESDE